MPSTDFYEIWPPRLSKEQLENLTQLAAAYALSHGLLYLPSAEHRPMIPNAAIHAPFSLFPTLFPRQLFEKAKRIQRAYNILYARIAMDEEFLDRVMGAEHGLGKVDDFIGRLWTGWKQLREVGLAQPLQLGLFRSDYLLHCQACKAQDLDIKQVEFNTIAASFGALSQRITTLQRYLYSATKYYDSLPAVELKDFPENNTIAGLADGLAAAHQAYGIESSQILFVVQPGERNVFDQRYLEYELLERHSIKCIRRTFQQLGQSASIDNKTSSLRIACARDVAPSGYIEISTVYYRAGYTPDEYSTSAHYDIRFLLEQSSAIKCPSIALQLAGGKKVQQVLTQPGVLESFLANDAKYGKDVLSTVEINELRGSFMEMWGLDVSQDMLTPDYEAVKAGREEFGVQKARRSAMSLVLKPQREGGGNNVYKETISTFLDNLPAKERQAWIAMQLIRPPDSGSYLVRAGSMDSESELPVKASTVSELGIFGWALFGCDQVMAEREVGWLVRTKGKESNEGGVATGFSVLDSLLLVE